jgi:RNA polymerase subunit RPABC4/transcription elongation factor Spt4
VKQINKIASIVVLTITGTILNVIFQGVFILTIIGCFALGYYLNRGNKSSAARMASPKLSSRKVEEIISQGKAYLQNPSRQTRMISTPRSLTGLQCRSCGATLKSGQRFCTECGSDASSGSGRDHKIACPSCNHVVPRSDKFCRNCGHSLSVRAG